MPARSAITSWAFRWWERTCRVCCRFIATPWTRAGHPGQRQGDARVPHVIARRRRAKAAAIARAPLNQYLKSIVDAASGWMSGVSSRDYPNYQKMIQSISEETFESRRCEKSARLDRHARRYPQCRSRPTTVRSVASDRRRCR